MDALFGLRAALVSFYSRHSRVSAFAVKLIIGLYVFNKIASFGHFYPAAELFSAWWAIAAFAAVFALFPASAGFLVASVYAAAAVSGYPLLAALTLLFLLCVFLFYARVAPRECVVVILMMIALRFNIPYAVIIGAAIYLGLTAFIPIVIGIFLYFAAIRFDLLLTVSVGDLSLANVAGDILELFRTLVAAFSDNYDWIPLSFVFALTFFLTHIVGQMFLPRGARPAIVAGVIFSALGVTLIKAIADVDANPLVYVPCALLSGVIVFVISFFDVHLVSKADDVRFEDDDNVYIVKIYPKNKLASEGVIKRENNFSRAALNENSDENLNQTLYKTGREARRDVLTDTEAVLALVNDDESDDISNTRMNLNINPNADLIEPYRRTPNSDFVEAINNTPPHKPRPRRRVNRRKKLDE